MQNILQRGWVKGLNSYNIHLPIGLCEITYDNIKLPNQGSEAVFSAIPTYIKLYGDQHNQVKGYLLEQYEVSFEVAIDKETYDVLKLAIPTVQEHEHGLYDQPSKVNMEGKQLIVHPYSAGESKEYDICIWNAIIDPEVEFRRVYDKMMNPILLRFIGKPVKHHRDKKLNNSYFFVGDWSKVGENSE